MAAELFCGNHGVQIGQQKITFDRSTDLDLDSDLVGSERFFFEPRRPCRRVRVCRTVRFARYGASPYGGVGPEWRI